MNGSILNNLRDLDDFNSDMDFESESNGGTLDSHRALDGFDRYMDFDLELNGGTINPHTDFGSHMDIDSDHDSNSDAGQSRAESDVANSGSYSPNRNRHTASPTPSIEEGYTYNAGDDMTDYTLDSTSGPTSALFIDHQYYQSQSDRFEHLRESLPDEIQEEWDHLKTTTVGTLLAELHDSDWRDQEISKLVDAASTVNPTQSFETSVEIYADKYQNAGIVPTANDKYLLNLSMEHPQHKLKTFFAILIKKVPCLVKFTTAESIRMDMEHQADIDSCFSYHKDFEKVIGKGTINILPKSDFKFQMQKQLDVPVSAVQNGLPTTRDLGSFGNIQIAQSERSRTYLCFSNHMTEYAADQEYIYNNFVYESLKHVMPAANLQRGRGLLGEEFFFATIYQGVKDSYSSNIGGSDLNYLHGNPMYKRKHSELGISTTPQIGFNIVDGGFTFVCENAGPFFTCTKNVMLGSNNIGGLTARPKASCPWSCTKVLAYCQFKNLSIIHTNAKTGISSLTPDDFRDCTTKMDNVLAAFMKYIDTARLEVRAPAEAIGQILEDFKNNIDRLDRTARRHLFFVAETETVIRYIITHMRALRTAAKLIREAVKKNPQLEKFHHEVACWLHSEVISLVSQPPGTYYGGNMDKATLGFYYRKVQEFGALHRRSFPIIEYLMNPGGVTLGRLRVPFGAMLLSFMPKYNTQVTRKARLPRTTGFQAALAHVAPDIVDHAFDVANGTYDPSADDDDNTSVSLNHRSEKEVIQELVKLLARRFPEHHPRMLRTLDLSKVAISRLVDPKNNPPFQIVKYTSGSVVNDYNSKLEEFITMDESRIARILATKGGNKLGLLAPYFSYLLTYLGTFKSRRLQGDNTAVTDLEKFKRRLKEALRNKFEFLPTRALIPSNTIRDTLTIKHEAKQMKFLRVYVETENNVIKYRFLNWAG
ncbi:hypothetical protein BDR26DRAFT_956947 [Obelidium mucronatum]|nr:hypothetical protein BDR26DRAFT_956947 [Obelidium mucronatum]